MAGTVRYCDTWLRAHELELVRWYTRAMRHFCLVASYAWYYACQALHGCTLHRYGAGGTPLRQAPAVISRAYYGLRQPTVSQMY